MEIPVEKILKKNGIDYRIIQLNERAFTVADVVQFSQGDIVPEEICKTIILEGKKTKQKLAILLRGNDKINFPRVKQRFGEEMRILNPEKVEEVGGAEPGAVCPFLLKIQLYVDGKVLELEKINCGSGNHLFGLEFDSKDLEKGIKYEVVEVSL